MFLVGKRHKRNMPSFKDLIRNCVPGLVGSTENTEAQNAELKALHTRVTKWIADQVQEPVDDPRESVKPKPLVVPHASGFETHPAQLERIYKRMGCNLESAFSEWQTWVEWRRDRGINDMKEEDFEPLTRMGFAEWRGQDKEGRPCLVLTARLLDSTLEPRPPVDLFQKYVIWMAEKGVHLCNELKVEHACILYDRRAIEDKHCSAKLQYECRPFLQQVSRFYARDRLGRIYILYLNFIFRFLLTYFLKPVMWLVDDASKITSTETRLELREFFDSDGLLLASAGLEEWPKESEPDVESDSEQESVTSNKEEGADVELMKSRDKTDAPVGMVREV